MQNNWNYYLYGCSTILPPLVILIVLSACLAGSRTALSLKPLPSLTRTSFNWIYVAKFIAPNSRRIPRIQDTSSHRVCVLVGPIILLMALVNRTWFLLEDHDLLKSPRFFQAQFVDFLKKVRTRLQISLSIKQEFFSSCPALCEQTRDCSAECMHNKLRAARARPTQTAPVRRLLALIRCFLKLRFTRPW